MPVLLDFSPARDNHPIRVLLTSPPIGRRGGVAGYLRALQPHFRDTLQYFTIGSRRDNERAATVALRLMGDSWRLARTLRDGGYDLVHLNPSIGPKALIRDGIFLAIAKTMHKTVIVFIHGWDDACEHTLLGRWGRLFHLVYDRADAFIVLGNEFREKLRSLGCSSKVFVQSAPIDDNLLDDCQQHSLPKCSGDRAKFNILFLARVEKGKGIYETLDTYGILKQKFPFVTLTIAGDGSELSSAIRYARVRRLEDVAFTGYVEGPAKYEAFRAASAYLFPSYTEGLPISVLEAMAYGLPIVTRAVGGLCDFFQNGRMGFITESRDPEVLAELLSRLIGNSTLRSTVSSFNQKYARNHFNATEVAARLEGIYRFVLKGADSPLLRAA